MDFYQVKVEFIIEGPKKPKKQTLTYLVNAMSVTESEARMTEWLKERGENDFEVKSSTLSKIVDIINHETQNT